VVKILTDQKTEVYSGCRFTTIRREFTKQGLRRIRKGVALSREES
jgi:spore coat polysaccharide biosynthesis predicted glycosyltransferase SpsG